LTSADMILNEWEQRRQNQAELISFFKQTFSCKPFQVNLLLRSSAPKPVNLRLALPSTLKTSKVVGSMDSLHGARVFAAFLLVVSLLFVLHSPNVAAGTWVWVNSALYRIVRGGLTRCAIEVGSGGRRLLAITGLNVTSKLSLTTNALSASEATDTSIPITCALFTSAFRCVC
jgi:hypothetical protein